MEISEADCIPMIAKEEPREKRSLKRKTLKAAINIDFLSKLLFDSA